jgi:hypothetical protein
MDNLIKQSPIHFSNDEIETIFIKNNNDINKTLNELWNLPEPIKIVKEKSLWDDVRDTCDAYDKEMYNVMHSKR